ncbi:MAG: DUF2470 domain-containing protein [Myxococcota bacterium]|nr:DUF2470 domain-containing protein [Myxococcota bacterium]
MTDSGTRAPRDHGSTATPADTARMSARAPSHAERCRTLVAGVRSGTLATIARDPEGFPYGSLVTVAIDAAGRPLMLFSRLAEHTQNLDGRADASMLLTEPLERHAQPLAVGRVTLLGHCRVVPAPELAEVRATFLAAQPDASYYVDFSDFAFYRLDPIALRYVGGFGRMSWVTADEYRAAEPDPLAPAAAGILTHMNDDHADAVLAYARVLASLPSATAATMTAVDRYGFELAATTPDGPKAARIAFDAPATTSDEVRKAMVALVKRARTDGA